ncbi:dihydrofolate reductase [Chryseobacterium sp. A301]
MTTLIVAMGQNREIGHDNKLLWHLPKDLKHFKALTSDHPIVMGRKTFESIGKPLPNRTNIVVSRKKDWFMEGVLIVGSLKEALKFAKKINPDIYVIGGGSLYEQTIENADRLEVTLVKTSLEADTFFPKIDSKLWIKTSERCEEADEKNEYDLCFQTYERKDAQKETEA